MLVKIKLSGETKNKKNVRMIVSLYHQLFSLIQILIFP